MPKYTIDVPDCVHERLVELLKSQHVPVGRNSLPAHVRAIACDAIAQFTAEGGRPYWIPTRTYDPKLIAKYLELSEDVDGLQEVYDHMTETKKKGNWTEFGFKGLPDFEMTMIGIKNQLQDAKNTRSNWLSKNRLFSVHQMGDLCKPVKVYNGRRRRRKSPGNSKPV